MNIEFDEDKYGLKPNAGNSSGTLNTVYSPAPAKKQPSMIAWLIKHGLAKSTNSANAILLVIVAINIVISIIIIRFII